MYLQTAHRRRMHPNSYKANVRDKLTETKTNIVDSARFRTEPMIQLIQRHRIGFVSESPEEPAATDSDKLHDLVEGSQYTLLDTKAVFPFVLFPDSLHIDRQKLTVIHRYFFGSSKIISVPLNDILNVEGNIGPIFGSLILTSKYFKNNIQSINFLWRKDAIQAQLLLQGYMVAHREKISCIGIETNELVTLLTNLGQTSVSAGGAY